MFAQDEVELLEAVNSSNLGECQRIVHKWGIDIVTTPGQFSRAAYTALHWMARDDHPDILEWVLLQGVNCGFQTRNGSTALSLAVLHGHIACVRLLVDFGADIAVVDEVELFMLSSLVSI
eukprot:m.421575 g.421575  ORF g.421575 m.421575 type:complete len:120 (-) comp56647_c0_seq13:797-1156(-)